MVKQNKKKLGIEAPKLNKQDYFFASLDPNHITKNKIEKSKIRNRQKIIKTQMKWEQKEKRERLNLPKQKPITQEDKRVKMQSILLTEDDKGGSEQMEEIQKEESIDEFKDYFDNKTTPKILITTAMTYLNLYREKNVSSLTLRFIKQLLTIFPNSQYIRRKGYPLKKIIEYSKNRGFTDVIVIGQVKRKPYSLIHSHLPKGPTATYRISPHKFSLVLQNQIKGRAKLLENDYNPELILSNFTSRLGTRISRMCSALFPLHPEFVGRRVVTIHNQRDFIFFRHHRYQFKKEGKECVLQEIGPRFTLQIMKLQLGTFDTKFGEYEFFYKTEMNRHQRTKFFL